MKEYLSNKGISYDNLATLCHTGILHQEHPELYLIDNEKYYIIYSNDIVENTYIFKNKLQIKLIRADKSYYEKNIICLHELFDLFEILQIKSKNIFINNDEQLNLEKEITHLNKWIKDDTMQLNENVLEIPIIEQKGRLSPHSSYTSSELSKFFYNYFPYEYKNDSNKITYIENDARKQIFQNLYDLYFKQNLTKFRLTGPTSNGKSFTLFFFSRYCTDVIYLNLKVLKAQNKKDNLEMIISELSGLIFSLKIIDSINCEIKKIDTDKNIYEIFLEILELICNNNILRLILIIDQYKVENYDSYPNFLKNIELLMNKYKKLKLVLCSSINDEKIRDDALTNLENNKGNPEYNEQSQNCLFYYAELYKRKNLNNNSINYLFDNRQKYIFLFQSQKKRKDIFEEISQKIKKKIEKFRVSKLNYQDKKIQYTFNDVLIYLKHIFNEKFDLKDIIEVLCACPLKYVKIIFEGEYFIVKPIFPFIKYFINNLINKDECEEYFKKKRYNLYSFQSNKIKAEYFEYSVQQALKNNNFFELPDKENREITLYEISKMNKISNFSFDLLGEYEINEDEEEGNDEKFIKLNENEIEENKSKSEDISEKKNDNNIFIDLNQINISSEKESSQSDNNQYIQELFNKFNIVEDIEENENDDFSYLSKMIKIHERSIEDFRNEIVKKYNNYEENKIEIKKLLKESKTNLNKFKGDENIFLTQSKFNGECIDYAILFGEKNDKTFVSFQMKCYGNNTNIPDDAIDKMYVKNKIKNILVNSIFLFNCEIKHWYYYIVCYFNESDIVNNNLNDKEIERCILKNIEILLYNPEKNKFYDKSKKEIYELPFTNSANLDYDNYKSDIKNFIYIPNTHAQGEEMDRLESINRFKNDLKSIINEDNPTLGTILDFINKIIKADSIAFAVCRINKNRIYYHPGYDKAIIYKTKRLNNYYCIVNTSSKEDDGDDHFEYYNLNKKKKQKKK